MRNNFEDEYYGESPLMFYNVAARRGTERCGHDLDNSRRRQVSVYVRASYIYISIHIMYTRLYSLCIRKIISNNDKREQY